MDLVDVKSRGAVKFKASWAHHGRYSKSDHLFKLALSEHLDCWVNIG